MALEIQILFETHKYSLDFFPNRQEGCFLRGVVEIEAKEGMQARFSVKAVWHLGKSHRVSCRLPLNMENNDRNGFAA